MGGQSGCIIIPLDVHFLTVCYKAFWYKLACMYNEYSNQSAHPHSLIKIALDKPLSAYQMPRVNKYAVICRLLITFAIQSNLQIQSI